MTRQKIIATWIAPQAPKMKIAGRKVEKLGIQKPVEKVKPVKARSVGEAMLELHLRAENVTGWVPEYRFDPERRWRADFGFLEARLLVEVEGGTWSAGGGRHTSGSGFQKDAEKYNAATLQNWRVLRYTTGMVKSGAAIRDICKALGK